MFEVMIYNWSTLDFYHDEHVLSLDTGCLWGGKLTAARIDSDEIEIVSIDCAKDNEIEGKNPTSADVSQI